MQKHYYENIKASKPFKRFDIIIYSLVILLVVFLFIFCIILPNKKETNGFIVNINDKTVLTYIYNDKIEIIDEYKNKIETDKKDNFEYITVFIDNEKTEYNIIRVDLTDFSVKVSEANCSNSHDCTSFPYLKKSGSIICLPHNLEILSLERSFTDPVVGG